jgi:hypothetical protein
MCDYSLHAVSSRPAQVGERLVTTRFAGSITRGFAAEGELGVAVCLRPGTEIAFDKNAESQGALSLFRNKQIGHRVARFRQINLKHAHQHHDALEFPDGQVILLTDLVEGQSAVVLQLPANEQARQADLSEPQIDTVATPI